jgi:predicted Fe-Mo cluster-binding NifX family protein
MGDGALTVLTQQGIEVYRGNSGDVRALVEDYLQGKLEDSGMGCHSHGDHECGH